MADPLQHIKGSKTQILDTFPTKTFGSNGDFVISRIKNKGVFLCTKAGGMWYVANQLQELRKVGDSTLDKITTKNLNVHGIVKASENTDKIIVSDKGRIKYRTSDELVGDLDIFLKDINYQQAYCSLGQYTNKEDCEANNGTWYYSDNDSHDSISSTAENELLTIASSLGKLDAEPTLLYDGSTLEIKRNSDFDDNWQTSAQDSLLKLSYGSSYNAIFGLSRTGNLTLDVVGDIELNVDGGQVHIKDDTASHFLFDCDATSFTIYDDTDEADLFSITVGASGATTIATVDDGAAVGHLTLQPDGDLILDPASQKTIISATDALYFDGGTHTLITESADDILDITVGGLKMMSFDEGNTIVQILDAHLAVAAGKGVYLDGGGDTLIYQHSADFVRYIVGGDVLLTMGENGNDGNEFTFNDASAGFARKEATFSTTGVIGSGGSDDTDIDFRHCNKFRLEMTADIHTINLIFPSMSGNFLLVCTTDGDHDVSYWKAFESDESAATTVDVMWAGGSVPAFTDSGVDIVSFYWDANEQQAYGTASLAFATP